MWTVLDDRIPHFRFAAVSSLIVFFYTSNVQNVDPEEYGGMMEIIKEGFMTGFATFLVRDLDGRSVLLSRCRFVQVSWIVLYSMFPPFHAFIVVAFTFFKHTHNT